MERCFMRPSAFLLTGFLLACAPPPPPDVDIIMPDTSANLVTCGAGDLQVLVGGPVTALPQTGGWRTVRIINPGDAVTQDFSETRLNVEVDGEERIVRLSCG
jgi:hypothetical protein